MTSKDVYIDTRSTSINALVKKLQKDVICINDKIYWSKQKQSRFIESLLMRIPLTDVYLDVSNTNKQIPIDGFERLNTLKIFVCGDMVLESLEFLTELEGVSYNTLCNTYKRVLDDTTIVLHNIEAQTPIELRKAIARRINPSRLYRWIDNTLGDTRW